MWFFVRHFGNTEKGKVNDCLGIQIQGSGHVRGGEGQHHQKSVSKVTCLNKIWTKTVLGGVWNRSRDCGEEWTLQHAVATWWKQSCAIVICEMWPSPPKVRSEPHGECYISRPWGSLTTGQVQEKDDIWNKVYKNMNSERVFFSLPPR